MKILCSYLFFAICCWQAPAERAFFFQPNNELVTTSLALLKLDRGSEVMSELTVCTWLKVHHFRENTYVFSYATSNRDNNELNMGIRPNGVYLAVDGRYRNSKINHIFVPDVWYHFCFVVARTSWVVYVNGKHDQEGTLEERRIFLNGSLVLGQEADLLEGGYQEQQSFSGFITGFNLFRRALKQNEVTSLATCVEGAGEGDLVGWSSAQWILSGPVEEVDVSRVDYCTKRARKNVFPERRSHSDAIRWCEKLKGKMALPKDADENVRLYHISEPFAGVCQPPNHANGFLWIAATDKGEEGHWTDFEGQPLNYKNFKGTYKYSDLDCACMLVPPYVEEWDDVKCGSLYKFCVACEEDQEAPSVLRMRGLCEQDEKAAWFTLQQRRGEKVLLKGFTKYLIYLEEESNKWHLYNMWINRTVATHKVQPGVYPLGVREWVINTSYQVCDKPEGSLITLGLSACYDWEYSCKDGTCIDLDQRCDLRVDCPDKSDEIGCDELLLPEDYLSQRTPPGGHVGGPLGVNLSISLHGFSEINVKDMKLTVEFNLLLSWYDSRLQYQNLKELADINYIKPSAVWSPTIELTNADFLRVDKTSQVLTVSRNSKPEKDDQSRVCYDKIYEGMKNPLELSHKMNAPFVCNMDLRMFPFDTQHCKLLLTLTSARVDFLHWRHLEVTYLGETFLTEYKVDNITIQKSSIRNYSVAEVGVTLHRRFWSYVTSAYIPTVMLMLISYASLFCKRENVELRVIMALTTLLVLYALYQQISDDLPKTAYIKAIDVWYFFAIMMMFTQVIYHIFLDLDISLRRNQGDDLTKDLWKNDGRKARIDWAFRVLYFVVKFIFFLAYGCVIVVNVESRGRQ
ncbi:uncharacterized protein LOC134783243 isoform X1 [Penaeus indicus]|uniref:uncharacterized protein LOC134783243 isoform X1 n=2 Tax=Penaeus indicus TaxID=29960 RepID=UPI00300CD5D4